MVFLVRAIWWVYPLFGAFLAYHVNGWTAAWGWNAWGQVLAWVLTTCVLILLGVVSAHPLERYEMELRRRKRERSEPEWKA